MKLVDDLAPLLHHTSPEAILSAICAHFHVTLAELRGPLRTGTVSAARRTAIVLLRASGRSLRETWQAVGRRCATDVTSAIRTAEADPARVRECVAVAQEIAGRERAERVAMAWGVGGTERRMVQ